jgi:hypothetical protein
MVVYQCQDTSKQPSISSNTQHPRNTLDERWDGRNQQHWSNLTTRQHTDWQQIQ